MRHKYQVKLTKLGWQQNLGVVAIALAAMGLSISSAQAIPTPNSFQLAQVGVRSQINAPTPLNITPPPGTHIPLPESNDDYGSYYEEQPGFIYYRDSRDYRRHESHYDDYDYDHEYHTHRHRRNKGGSIIIINLPSNY
jgi:hypothetical protein